MVGGAYVASHSRAPVSVIQISPGARTVTVQARSTIVAEKNRSEFADVGKPHTSPFPQTSTRLRSSRPLRDALPLASGARLRDRTGGRRVRLRYQELPQERACHAPPCLVKFRRVRASKREGLVIRV